MKKNNRNILFASVACYLGFLVILYLLLAHHSMVQSFDDHLTSWIQGHSSPWFDQLNIGLSTIGNSLYTSLLTLVVVIFLLYRKQVAWVAFLLVNLTFFTLLNSLVKVSVGRMRPTGHRLMAAGGFSFPSGHTTLAVVFYGSLFIIAGYLITNKKWQRLFRVFCILMIVAIGYSRVVVGDHYPTDVMGAWLLTTGDLLLSWYAFKTHVLVSSVNQKDQ